MPLDDPARFGDAETAIDHGDGRCRHHQIHDAIGHGPAANRDEKTRLAQDLGDWPRRSKLLIPGGWKIEEKKNDDCDQRQEGRCGVAAGESHR